jgi:protein involved in temperature-dependent protein secretion
MNTEQHLELALAYAEGGAKDAGAAPPRILLFPLLNVLGEWERAVTQLNVRGDVDRECMILALIFRRCCSARSYVNQFLPIRPKVIFATNKCQSLG